MGTSFILRVWSGTDILPTLKGRGFRGQPRSGRSHLGGISAPLAYIPVCIQSPSALTPCAADGTPQPHASRGNLSTENDRDQLTVPHESSKEEQH